MPALDSDSTRTPFARLADAPAGGRAPNKHAAGAAAGAMSVDAPANGETARTPLVQVVPVANGGMSGDELVVEKDGDEAVQRGAEEHHAHKWNQQHPGHEWGAEHKKGHH